jgi:hypothetical protein
VSPVKYELGFYVPEDGTLHSHPRENLNPYNNVECSFVFYSQTSGTEHLAFSHYHIIAPDNVVNNKLARTWTEAIVG